MKIKFMLLTLWVMLILACSEAKAPNSEDVVEEFQLRGSIAGVVTDLSGQPVSGVAATLDEKGYDSQTDSDGQYTIPNVPQGAYSITFTHALYHDTTVHNIAILEDQDLIVTNVNIRPKKTDEVLNSGFIRGVIIDSVTNEGVAGIAVSTESGATDISGSNGDFLISFVEAGTHKVSFTSDAYRDILDQNVSVEAQDTTDMGQVIMVQTENLPTGDVSGTIDVSILSNVSVIALPLDSTGNSETTITNVSGEFTLSQLTVGVYYIQVSGEFTSDIDTVTVIEDSTIVIQLTNVQRDNNKIERTVFGEFTEGMQYGDNVSTTSSIDSVIVEIQEQGSALVEETELGFSTITNRFSGNIYIPATDNEWTARVKAFDSEGRVIHFSEQQFDQRSGDVEFIPSDVWNAKPNIGGYIVSSTNPEVSINDRVNFYPVGIQGVDDSASPTIEWQAEGESTWTLLTNQDYTLAPSNADFDFEITFRAIDDEGNMTFKTFDTRVVIDQPELYIKSDSAAIIGRSFQVSDSITQDYGSIVKYEWKLPGESWVEGSSRESITMNTAGLQYISLRVTDDDGNIATDSLRIAVKGIFVDTRDNESYTYTILGNQTWMSENLNYAAPGAICFNNDPVYCEKWGKYYYPDMVLNGRSPTNSNPSGIQGYCPTGWHMPSHAEWLVLENFLIASSEEDDLTTQMLAAPIEWNENQLRLINELKVPDPFGFSARPSGYDNPWTVEFYAQNWLSFFLSNSTSSQPDELNYIRVNGGGKIDYNTEDQSGYSVRCVQD